MDRHMSRDRSKSPCLRWQWTRITCSLGFVCILVAIVSRIVMPMYVEYKIITNLPLSEGLEAFEAWKRPPVTPVMTLFVFNFTNTEAFLSGREKPNLVEVGPYVYKQKMYKTDLEFSSDGEELTHSVYREFYFDEMLSVSSDDRYVIVPNIPLFGLIKAMSSKSSTEKSIAKNLLESYASVGIDTEPFIKVSIKELFWGYPSILLSMNRQQTEENCKYGDDDFFSMFESEEESEEKINCDIVPGNLVPFGVFSARNATPLDARTVKTGKSLPFAKGEMVAWHGKKMLNYWSTEECNKVSGRDPSGLPLSLNADDVMNLFIGQICRPLTFKFEKHVQVEHFQALRFVPEETSFSSPDLVPENQCYCLNADQCLPSGLLDISGCQPGSPVYMSWPHFLHADPKLRKAVDGMEPNEEQHSFIIDMMTKYGIALKALARLQMNVKVEKHDGFGWFQNIAQDELYLPFMWLEEGVHGPSEVIKEKVEYLQKLPEMVANLQTFGLMILGLILLIPEVILWSRTCIADFR